MAISPLAQFGETLLKLAPYVIAAGVIFPVLSWRFACNVQQLVVRAWHRFDPGAGCPVEERGVEQPVVASRRNRPHEAT